MIGRLVAIAGSALALVSCKSSFEPTLSDSAGQTDLMTDTTSVRSQRQVSTSHNVPFQQDSLQRPKPYPPRNDGPRPAVYGPPPARMSPKK